MTLARNWARSSGSMAAALAALAAGCGGAAPPPADAPPIELLAPSPDGAPAPAAGDDVARGARALASNDAAGARAAFDQALRANPNNPDALYYEGVLADQAGDKATAEKDYTAALKAKPGHEQAAVNLSALQIDAERYEPALAVARAALAKHPDNGALHMNAAVASASKGDQPAASAEFALALRAAPDDPMFHLTYAHWLGVWKSTDPALAELKAARPLAAKMGGGALGVLAAIGHELHVLHAWADCTAVYDDAIARKDAAELRTERAACKAGAKDDAGALTDLRAAIAADGAYAPAHYYLGNELARAGQFKDAAAQYEAFLRLEPSGPMAAGAQTKLKLAKQRAGTP